MDLFRAGGAPVDEEKERKRRRDEALAWANKRREQRQQREREEAAQEGAGEEGEAPPQSGWSGLNPWSGSKRTPLPTKESVRRERQAQQPKQGSKFLGFIPTSSSSPQTLDEEIGYQYEASMMDKMRWKLIDVKHKVTPSRSRCCCCCSCTWCIIIVVIIVVLFLLTLVIGFAWKHKAWLIAL